MEDSKTAINGTIKAVPLEIHRRADSSDSLIKRSTLYIHVVRDGERLLVSGSCLEGNFNAVLAPEDVEKAQLRGDHTREEWAQIVDRLLLKTAIQDPHQELAIIARIRTDYSYDDTTTELVMDESQDADLPSPDLSLVVTTRGKFPITVGTLRLANIDTLEEDGLTDIVERERNVYNWLELMTAQYAQATKREVGLETENLKLLLEKDTLKLELDNLAAAYELIIADLNDKFLQVLNSKKQRIFQLENHQQDPLEHLNLRYISDNKMNLDHMTIDRSKIPDKLDSIYVLPQNGPKGEHQKRKGASEKSPRKRIRLVKKEPDDDEHDKGTIALRLRSSMSDHELVRSIVKHEEHDSDSENVPSDGSQSPDPSDAFVAKQSGESDKPGDFSDQIDAKTAPQDQETDYDTENEEQEPSHQEYQEKSREKGPITAADPSPQADPVQTDSADLATDYSDLA